MKIYDPDIVRFQRGEWVIFAGRIRAENIFALRVANQEAGDRRGNRSLSVNPHSEQQFRVVARRKADAGYLRRAVAVTMGSRRGFGDRMRVRVRQFAAG